MGKARVVPWLLAALAATASHAAPSGNHTSITIWAAAPPVSPAQYGGVAYGGYTPPTGAMITERRDVEIGAGEVRIAGVAATTDPASVQLRSVSEPGSLAISEQRFVPGATTPDEILAHHVGDPVTVVTAKGEVSGVLRSVDPQALVVEVGSGDQRRLQVMRRDGYVQDVRLPAGATVDKPSLVWRLTAKHPGKQTVEVTYRADAMSWTADYLAIFDEGAKTIDFSAWATVKNASGATFENAELTLVSGGGTSTAPANPYAAAASHPPPPTQRFVVPTPVRIGNGESVQVELMQPRVGAKARSVVSFEAMPDPSAGFQTYPGSDCNQLSAPNPGTSRAEVALEVDVPAQTQLPDGKVRLFKRKPDHLEMVTEDALHAGAGVARVRLAPDNDISGTRTQLSCNADEHNRTIHEKLEVKLENKGKQAVDVVVREFLWRWPIARIDEESTHGTRAGAQTQEYRVNVPASGKKSVTYTVVYTW